MLRLPCQLNSGLLSQCAKNTWSDFTVKKILSTTHVQSSLLLGSWTFGSWDLKKSLMTTLYGNVTLRSLVLSSRGKAVRSCAAGSWCPSVLLTVILLVLHIWGEGTVRRPVGLILLMPPSRIQILGYFIFTRCAANWKKEASFIENIQNLYLPNPIFFLSCEKQN